MVIYSYTRISDRRLCLKLCDLAIFLDWDEAEWDDDGELYSLSYNFKHISDKFKTPSFCKRVLQEMLDDDDGDFDLRYILSSRQIRNIRIVHQGCQRRIRVFKICSRLVYD